MDGSERRYVDNTIQVPSAGLTIRQKEPKNLEAPFDRIDSYLTPTELFYIRRPCATACVATLEIRLAHTERDGAIHAAGARQGRERGRAT